jgi:hypothetical protein
MTSNLAAKLHDITPKLASVTPLTRRGRKPEYDDPRLLDLLFQCWLDRERMCAKRLVIQLDPWLREYEAKNGAIAEDLRKSLLDISAASIDRVLKVRRDMWYAENGRLRA